jgi:hypothetical protein
MLSQMRDTSTSIQNESRMGVNFAQRTIDPRHRDFRNSVAKLARDPKNLLIESETINPLAGKHLLGNLTRKTFEFALRIRDAREDKPFDEPIKSSPV